jgi:ATP-binding cassette, subfamily B, bacterial
MKKLWGTTIFKISWRLGRDVIGKFPALTIGGIITSILSSNLPLIANAAQGTVINQLVDPTRVDNTLLYLAAGTFIALSLLGGFAASLNVWLRERIFRTAQRYFTTRYLAKVSSLETQHFTNPEINDSLKQASESYHWRPQQLYDDSVEFISSSTQLLGSIFITLAFSPLFGFLLVASILPGIWVRMRLTSRAWSIWDADTHTRRLFDSASGSMVEADSVTELRLFGARPYFLNLVHQIFTGFFNREAKQAEKKALLTALTSLFSDAIIAVFWLYGLTLVIDGTIDLGYFTFLAATALILRNALDQLRWILTGTYESAQYMQSYYKLMDLQPITKSGGIKAIDAPPLIEFQDVHFQYPFKGDVALQGINLTIQPGEKIALVGENGAGKSTLVKLMLRMYDPSQGRILVNGKDLKEYDLETWYRQFGVLFQNFSKFNFLNAQQSIGIADWSRIESLEEIQLAAQKSQADKFISQLDQKYAQILNPTFDKGTDLSGGQWQRIALARAFFRDAPVLILDEPTSAIDAQGEYEIFERLYEFAGNKTVIIISHRFSTVRRADRIFVVAGGKISESGTHEELLKLKGQYADSFHKQAEGYK